MKLSIMALSITITNATLSITTLSRMVFDTHQYCYGKCHNVVRRSAQITVFLWNALKTFTVKNALNSSKFLLEIFFKMYFWLQEINEIFLIIKRALNPFFPFTYESIKTFFSLTHKSIKLFFLSQLRAWKPFSLAKWKIQKNFFW